MPKITPSYVKDDLLASLKICGGYYKTKRDTAGNAMSPLVGFAATYMGLIIEDGNFSGKKIRMQHPKVLHFVGDEYFNFAMLEQYGWILNHFAYLLMDQVVVQDPDVFVGAPMGGIMLCAAMARNVGIRGIFAEKKQVPPEINSKALYEDPIFYDGFESLEIDRHEIIPGDRVVIVDDVCHNFSTAKKLIPKIEALGGEVVGIACAINRALDTAKAIDRPVYSLIHIPTAHYRQDDPLVAEDVARGNVVWTPKGKVEWARLQEFMK